MATAVQKITLSPSRDIPLNLLVLSQSNVRRTKAGVSLEELAADIGRRGLLQSLNVRPVLDEAGAETGTFEVPAGGRRFRALELLVKQKRLAKTAPVPCVVRDPSGPILAEDDSLAENIHRAPLHPLDQYRAFQALREKGQSEEEIAAAWFTTAAVVKQRLKLVAVSQKLLDLYAEDGMTLEQLMAFTVADDHKRQEQVWESIEKSWSKEPYQIRRMLTEKAVAASDRRVRFVGLEAYEAAGGAVMRDLFQADNGGWLEDIGLLDRLVGEKLKAEAESIATEGWKWIEVDVEFPYGHAGNLRKLEGAALAAAEQTEIDTLRTEYGKLEEEYGDADEVPEEADARLSEIEARLASFEERPIAYAPGDIARAGVFVSIGRDGLLSVDRGHVRPEDELPAGVDGETGEVLDDAEPGAPEPGAPVAQRAVITIGSQAPEPEEDEGDGIRPLPERLVSELTAHRTLALRDAVANHPDVAMTVLLHKLCGDLFLSGLHGACLEANVRTVYFPMQSVGLKDCLSAKSVEERHEAWKTEMPKDEPALWHWLEALDTTSRLALLAHCVSYGVNALYEKPNPYGGSGISQHGLERRLAQADRLAEALGLDMVDAGWQPTVDNYLGRVTKPRILEAVREAKGEAAAQLIDHLKKGDMAREAERLLEGTGWLPEPLRGMETEPAVEAAPTEALPDFLAGDATETHDPVTALAAE